MELMVPTDFKRVIPEEYNNLPRLSGRAEVAMVCIYLFNVHIFINIYIY
jgi:hypothetical protein